LKLRGLIILFSFFTGRKRKGGFKMILDKLGIFGWKEKDENLVMASLLTGDPLLLIGNHGCAKTLIGTKVAEAIGKKFLVYDASKAMFEDVLGYPNVEKLKHGIVEYVPSKVTVWDKELIMIDELNRAIPELQSKWLEIIRSRKIMGFETKVKWVWAAMNPMSYSATNALDEALIGRFAFFLYPPDVLQMSEQDRIKVTTHINGDDAPSISEWFDGENGKTISKDTVIDTGDKIAGMLKKSAVHFMKLKDSLTTLSEFLAKFSDLLMRETNGEISLDGRRLGFIYRNILANRSIELAKAELLGDDPGSFVESARYVVQSSIPIGLNDESVKREEAVHKMEICFNLLSSYFEKDSAIAKVNLIYELFTTDDLMRKAQILIKENLGDFVNSKAWTDLINSDNDISLLAYVALQVEAKKPGIIPKELLESLSKKISGNNLSSECIPKIKDEAIEYIDEIEALLKRQSDLELLVAYNRVRQIAKQDKITTADIHLAGMQIDQDIQAFSSLFSAEV
jgi:hypothetical protein